MNTKKSLVRNKKAQVGSGGILSAGVIIISLLLVGYIGVMILQSTTDATALEPYVNASIPGDGEMYNASQNLINVTGTVFSMYGVLIIVLIAATIIGLLLSSFVGGKFEE